MRKKAKKPKTFHFRSWMIGQLRRISHRYPPHYQVENAAREVYYIPSKTGKPMKRVNITCAKCGNKYPKKEVVRDHIEPVIDVKTGFPILPTGDDDWNTYLKRMFVLSEGMQMLCHDCHNLKTGKENKKRRKNYRKKVDKV